MKISQAHRVEAGLPFVEALARRMAATMPHSIDLSDLVQDGVIGLIDAAQKARASQVVNAALQAMAVSRELRETVGSDK